MPIPDASPAPPPSGIYGLPLKKSDDGMRENLPDGGYILWQIEKRQDGKEIWLPQDYFSPPKGIRS